MEKENPPIVLEAKGLRKEFRSGPRRIEVLRGAGLLLREGETLSIRGESGSGKSTFLNLLAGIEFAEEGEVAWKGTSLASLPERQLPRRRASFLGFVFQAFYLIPELDTLENVAFAARIAGAPPRQARERARQLLEEIGLAERLHSRPDQLSGGERQRTAIARALVNEPAVVLADEPTGNLDEATAERVMEQLFAVSRSRRTAFLLVTHSPSFAARAQRRLILANGVLS